MCAGLCSMFAIYFLCDDINYTDIPGVQLPIKDADVLLTAVDRHKWYKHLQSARDPSSLEPLGLIKQPMLVLGRRESLSLHHERSVKEQRAVVLLYSEVGTALLRGIEMKYLTFVSVSLQNSTTLLSFTIGVMDISFWRVSNL